MSDLCSECGAQHQGGRTCEDDFHEMLVWESQRPELFGEVHHLMVLSYYLQHPTLYSREGLQGAKQTLVDFLERGLTPAEIRRRDRTKLDSGKRSYKIAGTPANHGAYQYPIHWTMRAADVIAGSPANYCDNIRAWARSILDSLKQTPI